MGVNPMKKIHRLVLCLFMLGIPLQSPAAVIDLSEKDFQDARDFVALHKQNTGIVLNNNYSIGENKLFAERIIVRTKWHKLVLLQMVKGPGEAPTPEEIKTITADKNLEIDFILYGHSLCFAEDYKAAIMQDGKRFDPEKIHADHFEIAQRKQTLHPGFPEYRATLRTYFNLTPIDIEKPFTLLLMDNGLEKPFTIDLRNFR
jgi:hypothetical protein